MSALSIARERANEPASEKFSPVPFKLLPVVGAGGYYERVGSFEGMDFGDYEGQLFDPWKKGDPVVIEYKHVSTDAKFKKTTYSTWHVGKRATVPSAANHYIGLDDIENGGRRVELCAVSLWRIPYRYWSSALKLIGREFASRELLEREL